MRTFPDTRMRRLHAMAREAGEAQQQQDFPRALEAYLELGRQLESLGLRSAWVHWAIAVSHDHLEEYDMALHSIRRSLALDPLSTDSQRSFDIIVRRIHAHLQEVDVDDPSVPKLYALLQQSGDVDVPTHLLMARHLAATAQLERAVSLVDALCLTAPASRDVWAERARLARQQGDLSAAAGFEAEGQARGQDDVPFAISPHHQES